MCSMVLGNLERWDAVFEQRSGFAVSSYEKADFTESNLLATAKNLLKTVQESVVAWSFPIFLGLAWSKERRSTILLRGILHWERGKLSKDRWIDFPNLPPFHSCFHPFLAEKLPPWMWNGGVVIPRERNYFLSTSRSIFGSPWSPSSFSAFSALCDNFSRSSEMLQALLEHYRHLRKWSELMPIGCGNFRTDFYLKSYHL